MGGDYPLTGKTWLYTPWNSQKPVRTGTVRCRIPSLEKGVQTEGLHDTIGILLACIDQCALQTPLFRRSYMTPHCLKRHQHMLKCCWRWKQVCRRWGEQLAVALEAVQAFARVVGSGHNDETCARCMIGPMEGALFGPTWMSRGIQWGSLACAGSLGRLCAPEGAPENKPAPKDSSVPTSIFRRELLVSGKVFEQKNNEDNEGKLSFRWSTSPW